MSPTAIVGYLALFSSLGILFLFANLLLGHFVRPDSPNKEKLEIYECGEPTIGSSFVQFDLRFYVVALLFIIFDVEVAFFFPWAVVFGKSTHLMDPHAQVVQIASASTGGTGAPAGGTATIELTPAARNVLGSMGVPTPNVPDPKQDELSNSLRIRSTAQRMALTSVYDILVFFAVLMVGFAYVWRRGDLDWVRAVTRERAMPRDEDEPPVEVHEPVLV
jgi:NADH-quinone oxidoreductase subunit A